MNTRDLREAMDELARDVPAPDYAADAWQRGRRARRRHRWTVTAAAATAVAAIGASSWLTGLLPFAADDQYLDGTGEKPFATYQGRGGTMLGGITGKLTLEDGCIRIGGDLPVLLPDRTRWNPARQELTLDGNSIRIGEEGGFGGGWVDENTDVQNIPAGCYDDHFTKVQRLLSIGRILGK